MIKGYVMIKVFDHSEGVGLLVRLALGNALVPIIGSGFTMGARSEGGSVPGGIDLKLIMKNQIIKCGKKYTNGELDGCNFNDIADIFLDSDEVPKSIRLEVFRKYFTNVRLDRHKIDFLNTYWKYIYNKCR